MNENTYILHLFLYILIINVSFQWSYYILLEYIYILYIFQYMLMIIVSFSMMLLHVGWNYICFVYIFKHFTELCQVFNVFIILWMKIHTFCIYFHICWWHLLVFHWWYYILLENIYSLYIFSYMLMILVSFSMMLLHVGWKYMHFICFYIYFDNWC